MKLNTIIKTLEKLHMEILLNAKEISPAMYAESDNYIRKTIKALKEES